MRLDDLAGHAAEQARANAAASRPLDPTAYRARRERRNQRRALVFSGVFVVVALVVAILVSPPEEDLAVPTTTIPGVTSTTVRTATSTTVGPQPSSAPLLGAGWEELDAGPIAGRHRMAAVWTDFGLFVWGGHDLAQEVPGVVLQDGYLYDAESGGWREVASPPETLCRLSTPRAIWLESTVFVHGVPGASTGCGRAALYDPVADAWQVLDSNFPSAIGPETTLAWTGELLVAPTLGIAYDPVRALPIEIPSAPRDADTLVHSRQRAHWTGSEVLVIGSGRVYGWTPGDPEWRALAGPPVPDRARDSVWTDDGLLVVNYQMATAVLNQETELWSRPGDLPLRFFECLPEASAVAGTPVVRMCSGLAVWDEVRSSWIPIPLENLSEGSQGSGVLVGSDDAIYSVGDRREFRGGEERSGSPTFRRFRIVRDGTGAIVPPPTMPIGVMQLDVPDGWELHHATAPVQSPEGFIPEDETIGLLFVTTGEEQRTCDVESTYTGEGWQPPDGFAEIGPIAVDRRGRSPLQGTAYRFTSSPSDWGGTGLAFPDDNGSDLVWVMCEGYSEQTLQDSQAFAAGLWSPWEKPAAEVPQLVAGTGWEEISRSPVAGRMRVAAAWTGEEIFVWGGHQGYSQETPDVSVFHQGADLFEPGTGTWRTASAPPDGLCPLTGASATWIGDAVLIRGAAQFRAGCVGNAAGYDPVGDSWTVFSGRFFKIVPYRAEVVWTGEWLAAPAFGVAWVPVAGGGQTIEIPVVPEAGSTVGSPTISHWTGDRIVAVGAGDVYTLVPGDDDWVRFDGPPLAEGGRDSVWSDGWLYVAQYDNAAARFDFQEWEMINLPLRSSECDPEKIIAASLPVARSCSGMAIWDPARSFWVPIPLDVVSGLSWWTTVVGTDDAIYSFGERVLRYPIERLGDGSVLNPPTIPVGVMQLDIPPGFWLRSTVGLTSTTWPDGSHGEVVGFALEGLRGTCLVSARYGGPELPVDLDAVPLGPGEWSTVYLEEERSWVVVVGEGLDTIWFQCDSAEDAELLVDGFWLPGE